MSTASPKPSPRPSPRPSLDEERPETPSQSSTEQASHLDNSPRRKSIQFSVATAAEPQPEQRSSSASGRRRRVSQPDVPDREKDKDRNTARGGSPPPPKTYERGVSFNTFDNPDAADFSLTLNYKHKGYQCTRRSRTFLCGTDQNDYSDFALEWLIDELVDDGDEIVCLRAVEKDSSIASDAGIEAGKHRQEAEKLFEQVIQKNSQDEKAISLVLELAVGKVQDIIQRMIRIYEPAVLIVGTRGRSLGGVQALLPGSVSKYCLQQSPIPVIVVRPSPKREKKKKKRLADPTRRSYNHILEMSERRGSHIFDRKSSAESSTARLPDEEAAVAAALGLPPSYQNSRTSLSTSERSGSVSHEDASSTGESPDAAVTSPLPNSVDNTESEGDDGDEADDEKEKEDQPVYSSNTNIPLIVTEDDTATNQ
ncbi:universal stress protein [Aspergillus candidus]|uniref:Adenine nucleotide alpha hydrolases-like protein n=1 Tax=Aspergillus candidus TaxID=41067 RepID=A0A2I2FFP4_ASPCN|nr:adenine nucleotide alpha hydrolases-like protein [Aspergillus candidus]PLB39447.1 adenine nucleotide alpha hydrolases-like protein [Aspergillus candidus]